MTGFLSPVEDFSEQKNVSKSKGVTIYAKHGKPVKAIFSGRVVQPADLTGSDKKGNRVWILCQNNLYVSYNNLKFVSSFKPGMNVVQGDVIGFVGDTAGRPGQVYRDKSGGGKITIEFYVQQGQTLKQINSVKI
jgi:murein DD-endopeptidase MepM/ murein hydrolase activator NlpD